ncbi:hypothetical protein HK107_06860 [Parvularcula sp. ZS-1/3]|uniref:Ubiquinone biosynthesis protein n=1 Tax=Parvularcula mediterranea TaxID=2732508 RepID=A0A7Y3RL22_9PROT|nr:Coq4 family protein [Parvularcula mediterranea]NNU16039.1 hypothetical protein [Parvularcula mediterranea]
MEFREDMYPPAQPVRPLHAIKTFMVFMRDKEDTRQVFNFINALNGTSVRPAFDRFFEGPNGKLLLEKDPQALLRAFDDRETLRQLPIGTVGRTYADFMDREGLDTDGVSQANKEAGFFTDEFARDYPEYAAFIWMMNLTHDLYHVLTGYNRDSLGEAALLNFSAVMSCSRGTRALSWLAAARIKSEAPGLPIFKINAYGRKMGLEAKDLLKADWIGMLERPLREVREELNIVPDPVYAALPQERLLALVAPQAA